MKKYLIKFEFCGKFMRIEVNANSPEQAIEEVKKKINIHSINQITEPDSDIEYLMNMFGMK